MATLAEVIGNDPVDLTVAGSTVPLDSVGTITLRAGRRGSTDAPKPGRATFTVHRTALTQLPAVADVVDIDTTIAARSYFGVETGSAVHRFKGRITDAEVVPVRGGEDRVAITAMGPLAPFRRLVIGDEPWPVETDGDRAQRIFDHVADGFTSNIADSGTVQVMGEDVDARQVGEIFDRLAASSGGQLWERRTGDLRWWDAEHRRNLPDVAQLDASDVGLDTRWRTDLDGLVNDVTVYYGAEDSEGEQAKVNVVDQVSVDTYGRYTAKVRTILPDAVKASDRAILILGRHSRPRWRLDRVHVDLLRTLDPTAAGGLLNAYAGEAPLTLTGFPDSGPWTTGRVHVEGYTETISRHAWTLDLAVSDYGATGAPIRWVDVPPEVTWAEVDAGLSWIGAAGWYPGPVDLGRWVDVPADHQWYTLSPSYTWQTYDF